MPLIEVMTQVSPILGQIIEGHMQNLGQNEIGLSILHQIIKIFYTANQLYICPFLREENALAPWI